MAVLYKAKDLELGRIVAIKVLRPSLVSDPEFLTRFKREARSAANLSHPNIVTVHDVGQDGPHTHYIVMEYAEGQNLKQLIRVRGSFEVDAALDIMIEVCKGIGYAHRAGLIHCDVKPQNILITPDNSIKVVDFGIARAFTDATPQEREDMVWGSPHYFSPEVASGHSPTPASDVYSLGVVTFELLTGRLPFIGSDYDELALAHIQQDPPSVQDVNPSVPQDLSRIVEKALAKHPDARFQTADQFGRILQAYEDQGLQRTSSFVVKPSRASMPDNGGDDSRQRGYDQPTLSGQQHRPEYPPPPQRNYRPPQPPRQQAQSPQSSGEMTMPSLPPVDIDRIMGRRSSPSQGQSASVPRASYDSNAYPSSSYEAYGDDYYDDDEAASPFDFYGLVLGVFAAAAVLGLIPLWITVFITLTR